MKNQLSQRKFHITNKIFVLRSNVGFDEKFNGRNARGGFIYTYVYTYIYAHTRMVLGFFSVELG